MIYYAGVYRIALRIKSELTLAQGESQLCLYALEIALSSSVSA